MAKKRSVFNIQKTKSKSGLITYKATVVLSGSGNKRQRIKKSFYNENDAKSWIESTRVMVRKNEAILSPTLTIGEFLNHWLDNKNEYRKKVHDYTHQRHRQHLAHPIREIGHIRIKDLKCDHVYEMREKLLKHLAPRSVLNMETLLKGTFKDGEGVLFQVQDNPLRKLERMSQEELMGITGDLEDDEKADEKLEWFEPKEQQILIETAKAYSEGVRSLNYSVPREKDLRPYIRIYLGLHTGMRSGEISALTWRKIDLINGTININRTVHYAGGDTNPALKLPKTKKSLRVIELTPNDIAELKSYKLWMQEKLLPTRADINKVPLIFSDDFGLPHRSQIRKIYETIVKQGKLEHRGFHSLRHTHASNLFEADFDILTVSKRFGHSSVAITMDIYTHFFERKKKKDAKRLLDVQQSMQSSS